MSDYQLITYERLDKGTIYNKVFEWKFFKLMGEKKKLLDKGEITGWSSIESIKRFWTETKINELIKRHEKETENGCDAKTAV